MSTLPKWFSSLRYSVDWVNVVVDAPNVYQFMDELCNATGLYMEDFSPMYKGGLHWYAKSFNYAPAGRSAIVLSYTPLNGSEFGDVATSSSELNQHGIFVSISGDGCRYIDDSSRHAFKGGLREFLCCCRKYPWHCTRLDAAMDIIDSENPIVPLFTDFAHNAYNREPDGHVAIVGGYHRKPGYVTYQANFDPVVGEYTENVYVGPRTSEKGTCCVYNKRLEIESGRLASKADSIKEKLGVDDYWYRVEYRAKNNKLTTLAFNAACDNNADAVFFSMADNFFDFINLTCSSLITNNNLVDDWALFLGWLEESLQNAHFV